MSLGIKVRVFDDVKVWAGTYLHSYAFPSREAASAFISNHWSQFSDKWRRRNLEVREFGDEK